MLCEFYAKGNPMIKFILLILISNLAHTAELSCDPSAREEQTILWSLIKEGGTAFAEYKERCEREKRVIAEAAPKKNGPTEEQCDACKEKYKGSRLHLSGNCVNILGCSNFAIFFLKFDLKASTQALSTGCEDALFCSEETSQCEYICPDTFEYNRVSGLCEKSCLSSEIYVENSCQTCPEGKVPNQDQTACVCPAGQEEQNGVCYAVRCPGVRLPSMILTWYYEYDPANLEAIPRARQSWAVDYGDYLCTWVRGPEGFRGNLQIIGDQYGTESLPTTIRFLYPDIRNYTVSQLMSSGNDIVKDTSAAGLLENCKHLVTGESIGVCDPAQANNQYFNSGFYLRSYNVPTISGETSVP